MKFWVVLIRGEEVKIPSPISWVLSQLGGIPVPLLQDIVGSGNRTCQWESLLLASLVVSLYGHTAIQHVTYCPVLRSSEKMGLAQCWVENVFLVCFFQYCDACFCFLSSLCQFDLRNIYGNNFWIPLIEKIKQYNKTLFQIPDVYSCPDCSTLMQV